ncbi:MAG: hypothetical protein RSE93_02205 [Oscillospiraceae bacterium]
MGKFLAIISSMKSNDRKNIIITFLIILLIPIIFLNFFLSIFIYKSNDPQDKYLISAEQVAFELNTPNRLDGNLIKSIYFLYKYKETEELWEIKKFIKDFFVNSYIGYDENGMPMIFYFFKSYLEIQAMLLLPPFSFSPTEMILINLYLFMPPDDFDDDINIGEIPDGGHIEGGNGNIDNIGGGGEKPNYLPFRVKSPCNGTITSYYGLRTHPVTGEKLSFHRVMLI